MIFFVVLLVGVTLQRLIELVIARRNETWMKAKGAIEYGKEHYKYLVLMHMLFFVSLVAEVVLLQKSLSPIWPLFLTIFGFAQGLRIWSLATLGKYWNTKIIILPGAKVVAGGPYRYFRHPNYLVVVIELLTLPLLFHAYITAILFSVLNMMFLSIRIGIEEKALKEKTNYGEIFPSKV